MLYHTFVSGVLNLVGLVAPLAPARPVNPPVSQLSVVVVADMLSWMTPRLAPLYSFRQLVSLILFRG